MKNTKIRGIKDNELSAVLTHHADVLRGMSMALTKLIRERRLGLLWAAAVTVAVIYLAVR